MKPWRFGREYYYRWKEYFLNQPPVNLTTESTCAMCLIPMNPQEIMLRALISAEKAVPVKAGCLNTPDGTYIIYSYVCSRSVLTEDMIDDLILISSGLFDFGRWDWTDEAVRRAVLAVEGGEANDKLDWRAISAFQKVSAAYRQKRRFFFTVGSELIPKQYVAKTKAQKEKEDAKRKAKKTAPWLHD